MPVVQSSAYSSVEGVFQVARARINDMLTSTAGEVLTDSAPFTFVMLNEAAFHFQNKLSNNGVNTFEKETLLTPITACNFPNLGLGNADAGQTVNVSDVGYFDGSMQNYPPQLPPDLISPMKLWERQTGQTEAWLYMEQAVAGLPNVAQGQRLRYWEWVTEMIVMRGASQTNDIRLRYLANSALFATPADTIHVRGSQYAIGCYLAAIFINSRDPEAAASFEIAGDTHTMQIVNQNTRARQHRTITRRSYGFTTRTWRN
jgi:hypothetical protein